MKTEEENMEWDKDAPLLAAITKTDTFKVPDSYFENLSDQIISKIHLDELDNHTEGFTTPENYFEQLRQNITASISLENIKEENSGFSVPVFYFEKSKQTILNKVQSKPSKKGNIFNLNVVRYAAAACILLSTSIGIYFNIQRTQSVSYQLSKLADEDIESYLKSHTEVNDVPIIIENIEAADEIKIGETTLDNKEVQQYLEQTW